MVAEDDEDTGKKHEEDEDEEYEVNQDKDEQQDMCADAENHRVRHLFSAVLNTAQWRQRGGGSPHPLPFFGYQKWVNGD